MTIANASDWNACENPGEMLGFLTESLVGPPAPSDRKLRLWACACCRQVLHLLTNKLSRKAVEVAERYADAGATDDELAGAFETAPAEVSEAYGMVDLAWMACSRTDSDNQATITDFFRYTHPAEYDARFAALLRDIIGNPFKPITINPVWLSPTALSIATRIYDDRDFTPAAYAVLWDSLEDAGADDERIRRHCMGEAECARTGWRKREVMCSRGCWVLDAILGKE